MAKSKKQTAVFGLAGRRLVQAVEALYEVDEPRRPHLNTAALMLDRAAELRRVIDREGVSVTDRFGQVRPHPLLDAERRAHSEARMALRELGLSTVDADEARPPRIGGRYVQEG
jgi:hypothetical protein